MRLSPRRAALLALWLLLAFMLYQHQHQQLQLQPRDQSSPTHSARQTSSAVPAPAPAAVAASPRPEVSGPVDQAELGPTELGQPATQLPATLLSGNIPQHTAAQRHVLPQGEMLQEGEYLVSPHSRFFVRLEGGVAKAIQGTPTDPAPGPSLWDTTQGPARPIRRGAYALVVQEDGAVAVVIHDGTAGQSLVWSSPSASSAQATAAITRYELRLEDDGAAGDGPAWSAAVYTVPTAPDEDRGGPAAPAKVANRLFYLPVQKPDSSELIRLKTAGTSSPLVQLSSNGRVCFRSSNRGECAPQQVGLCTDEEKCVLQNLWDAQALCSLHSSCSGVARLPSSTPPTSSQYAHPKHVFAVCGASMPPMHKSTTAVEAEQTWVKTACDADTNAIEILSRINLVMTVKTSGQAHSTRVQSMLRSWGSMPAVRKLLYFFTDVQSDLVETELAVMAGNGDESTGRQHFINTGCPSGHDRAALCCKTDSELRFFLQQMTSAESDLPSFWCHFDDDNYVMVPHLVEYLSKEGNGTEAPLWIGRRGPKHMKGRDIWPFAMGGAGYCMDHRAAMELGRQSLVDECAAAQQPDDMTIGLVMQRQNVALRHSPRFHSQWEIYKRHLEDTILWDTEQRRTGERTTTPMAAQITLGWDFWSKQRHDLRRDMLQLHYYLLLEARMTADLMGVCFSAARAGFLRGCLSCEAVGATDCTDTAEGCALTASLAEAQERCIAAPHCAGVTKGVGGEFTCRVRPTLERSPSDEQTWLKQTCRLYGEEDMPPTEFKT